MDLFFVYSSLYITIISSASTFAHEQTSKVNVEVAGYPAIKITVHFKGFLKSIRPQKPPKGKKNLGGSCISDIVMTCKMVNKLF